MEDVLYLEVCGPPGADGSAEVSVESLVVLSVARYCGCELDTRWVVGAPRASLPAPLPPAARAASLAPLSRPPALVSGPLQQVGGLCACARRLALATPALLGFRAGCLQAPNETSAWTKFCELQAPAALAAAIDSFRRAEADTDSTVQIPEALIKFEHHLNKPIRVHNVYKLARDIAKQSAKNESPRRSIPSEKTISNTPRDNVKHRKWKSKKTIVQDVDLPLDKLGLLHEFAEGPHLTLADVILYSCFYLIIVHLDRKQLKNVIPTALKWFDRLRDLEAFAAISLFLEKVNSLTFRSTVRSEFEVSPDVPTVENVSLYKRDPKRNSKKKKMYTKEEDIESALGAVTESLELKWSVDDDSPKIDWSKIPPEADPHGGHLPDDRKDRKTEQLENLASATMKIAKDKNVIVDFCSGGGHLGILLGYLLPECTVILLENKERSLEKARARVESLKLTNVRFVQSNLDFFTGRFDIGVALHACGVSTDLVLEKCLDKNAAFVICPCCYGSVHETDRLRYPRSREFSVLTVEEYVRIGHAADQTHVDHPLEERGARCMSVIDSDRARHAMSEGYSVTLSRLKPLSCTPKNMLLVGIPGRSIDVSPET